LIKFCVCEVYTQNLIPNPSFEDTIQLNFGLTFPRFWTQPTNGNPNHYSPHSRPEWQVPQNYVGYQLAYKGENYVGILMHKMLPQGSDSKREYFQIKLEDSLKKDSTYCLQLFLSLADSCQYASRNQLGIYLSNSEVSVNTTFRLQYKPQILVVSSQEYFEEKDRWVEFNFEYIAEGKEKYLIIGNFNDTSGVEKKFIGGGSNLIIRVPTTT